MKRKLLFAFTFIGVAAFAQQTHHVDWGIGAPAGQFSKIIGQGDTVMWTWTTAHNHNVTTNAGSTETFASPTSNVVGNTYSHTFTLIGTNPYKCTVHGSSMAGVITVDSNAGTDKVNRKTFNVWPNPVVDALNISAETVIDNIRIYDMGGKLIMDSTNAGNSEAKVYMDKFPGGTYLVTVTAGGKQTTASIVKQ